MHIPPIVALFLTVAFIVFLFRRDIRERPNVTGALWLPLIWMLFVGSRSPTDWLNLGGFVSLSPTEEGSPIDALVYFILLAAGIYVLNKRQVRLSEIVRNNGWLVAFLLYGFLAIYWSDFPFVAFKRWIKLFNHPVMVLVLFTEPDPKEAVIRLMKRSAYVLVPMSILFIKYYPELGRGFEEWSGEGTNKGIAVTKNMLGCSCLVLGLFLFWHVLNAWRTKRSTARRNDILLTAGLLFMIGWLLWKAHSATSTLSMLIGVLLLLLLGRPWMNKRLIGVYVLLAVVMLGVGQLMFGIFGRVVDLSGHDSTIVGRAQIWNELLAFHTNPIFGVGFESFWLGDRVRTISAVHWFHLTEAHNGYLETYLNLGLVGLFMLAGIIIATFRKILLEFLRDFEWGRLRLSFLAVVIFYNWTEAAFKGLHPIWFVFYIICLDYPKPEYEPVTQFSDAAGLEEDAELIHFHEKI